MLVEARNGAFPPILARDETTAPFVDGLLARRPFRMLLIGARGVGKTSIVQQVALELSTHAPNRVPILYALSVHALQGTTILIAEAADQLLSAAADESDLCFFIEDIDYVLQKGERERGRIEKLVELLRTGPMSFIGEMSAEAYASLKRVESEFFESCTIVQIEPLSAEATLEILEGRKQEYFERLNIHISAAAIRAAVELTQEYLPTHSLPGGALEVLQTACDRFALKHEVSRQEGVDAYSDTSMTHLGTKVSHYDVKRVVEEMTSLDIDSQKKKTLAHRLEKRLGRRIVGQDESGRRLCGLVAEACVNFSMAGHVGSCLFVMGPSGVGKTFSIRVLAESLLHDADDIAIYDLKEHAGEEAVADLFGLRAGHAPRPGDQSVAATIRKAPISFVVFRNPSQADPRFFRTLEKILATGGLRISGKSQVDFRRTFVFLVEDGECRYRQSTFTDDNREIDTSQYLPTEIATQLAGAVGFTELSEEHYHEIIRRSVKSFQGEYIQDRPQVRIHRRVLEVLLDKTARSNRGAHALNERLDKHIFEPGRKVLAKRRDRSNDGHLTVKLVDQDIRIQFESASKT